MKKNWWLNLYTYPALKQHLKVCCFIAFFDCFLGWGLLSPVICMFFVIKSFHKGKASFFQNLDFHALHIPYTQLKRDFLSHLGIVFTFVAVTGVILYSFKTPYEAEDSLFFTVALWSMFFMSEVMKPRKQAALENMSLLKQFSFMMAGFFVFIITLVLASPFFGLTLAMLTFVGGCVVSTLIINLQVLFHEIVSPVSYKYRTKYAAMGVSLGFALITGMGFIVSRESVYSNLQATTKVEALRQWPGFIHEISSEALIEMGPHLKDGKDHALVYSKARPAELHEIPVSYHMKDLRKFIAYIKYGHPPHGNFMQMAEYISKDKRFSARNFTQARLLLREHWPQNTELHSMFQENRRHESVEGVEREIATIEEKQAHVHREPEIEE